MPALLAATLFSSAFGIVLRIAMDRRCNPWAVGVVNYVAATAIQLIRHAATGLPWQADARTVGIGAAVGALYAFNFLLFVPLLGRRGVSVPSAMSRLAVVFPIAASLLVWGERLDAPQAAGLALSLVAMPLLTLSPTHRPHSGEGAGDLPTRPRRHIDARTAALLVALLCGNGFSMVLTKAWERSAPAGQQALYLASLFGCAGLVAGAFWLAHRRGSGRRDLIPGAALGATNALSNWGLVAALSILPAVLVFPFFSAAGLVFTAILARLLFRETITRLESTGIVVTLAAVTLANLG